MQQVARFVERLTQHQVAEQSTIIAFNIIYAMFPLAICLTAIGGYVFRSGPAHAGLLRALEAALPVQVAKEMADVINTAGRHSGLLGIIGFFALFWTGSNLFAAIEAAFAKIFGVAPRGIVHQRLVSFLMIIVFSALLLLAVGASNLALLGGRTLGRAPVGEVLGLLGGWLFAILTPLALYLVVPNVRLPARALWPSALVAGTALQLVTLLFPCYIRYVAGVNRFGDAFSLTFLLMTWSYLVAFVLLFGAEVSALRAAAPIQAAMLASRLRSDG